MSLVQYATADNPKAYKTLNLGLLVLWQLWKPYQGHRTASALSNVGQGFPEDTYDQVLFKISSEIYHIKQRLHIDMKV